LDRTANSTKYDIIGDVLQRARQDVGDLFSSGLSGADRTSTFLCELAADFERVGLLGGAELLRGLHEELSLVKISASWTPRQATRIYAQIWKYIRNCLRELELRKATSFDS
jgi:hypothetical protein